MHSPDRVARLIVTLSAAGYRWRIVVSTPGKHTVRRRRHLGAASGALQVGLEGRRGGERRHSTEHRSCSENGPEKAQQPSYQEFANGIPQREESVPSCSPGHAADTETDSSLRPSARALGVAQNDRRSGERAMLETAKHCESQ